MPASSPPTLSDWSDDSLLAAMLSSLRAGGLFSVLAGLGLGPAIQSEFFRRGYSFMLLDQGLYVVCGRSNSVVCAVI